MTALLIIGYVFVALATTIVIGVLNNKGIIDWEPDADPPPMIAGFFWPIFGAIMAIVWTITWLYRGCNYAANWLSQIKIERE